MAATLRGATLAQAAGSFQATAAKGGRLIEGTEFSEELFYF